MKLSPELKARENELLAQRARIDEDLVGIRAALQVAAAFEGALAAQAEAAKTEE